MGENTNIAWCDHTFNPWWGCEKISPACDNCYAERDARRYGYDCFGHDNPRRFLGEANWARPMKWNKMAAEAGVRRRVFCGSMCDVFEDRPDIVLRRWRLWRLIAATPNLDWLLLTKRPVNIQSMVPREWFVDQFPKNIWLGATVENQEEAEKRIPLLLKCPAPVRFLSMEPLLGPVDLTAVQTLSKWPGKSECSKLNCIRGYTYSRRERFVLNGIVEEEGNTPFVDTENTGQIDWVIVGGESGPNARPMHPQWVRSIRDQCQAAGVAFFFKQHGEWIGMPDYSFSKLGKIEDYEYKMLFPNGVDAATIPREDRPAYGKQLGALPESIMRVGKKKSGDLLDGREWKEFPR